MRGTLKGLWRNLRIWVVASLLVLLSSATSSFGCPSCKDAIASTSQDIDLVRGFGWSIIFMLSAPFVIFASLGTYFYILVQRAATKQADDPFLELTTG